MALRPAKCYRSTKDRPYTRISTKIMKKSYVKGVPSSKIAQFDAGNVEGKFTNELHLLANEKGQIRHNALEAARQSANRYLEKKIGDYHLRIHVYPHHVLRENPIATGAGADRFQEGMSRAFGKPIGRAARVSQGQRIMTVRVNKEGVVVAKDALRRAAMKFPIPCHIAEEVKEIDREEV
jgi:large subunit ribosomal protein L10e